MDGNSSASQELAQIAARLVVDEGLELAAAKQAAARELQKQGYGRLPLPSSETVEAAVREHIALFCEHTQPQELLALRRLALAWMQKLTAFKPHLSGAVWRGTATRLSAIHLDLYEDDPKAPELALIDLRVAYESSDPGGALAWPVLRLDLPCPELGDTAALFLILHPFDDLRGALKPDAKGQSWRGSLAALEALLKQDATD